MAKEEKVFPKEETESIEETFGLEVELIPEIEITPQVDVKIITNVVKTPKAPKIIPYSVIRIITPYDYYGEPISGCVANYTPLQVIDIEKDRVYIGKPLRRWVPIENVELV